ncbi:MAG: DUF4912 domain-containing protein [Candidatus Eisenbacteria sp.]|nr:DUF4912 domain-containing protein [Candidatus Eisenbacteria bacterium]
MRRAELEAKTKQELLDLAREMDLPGRSQLSKDGLIQAILRRRARQRRPAFGRPAATRKTPAPSTAVARAKKTPAARAAGSTGRPVADRVAEGKKKAATRSAGTARGAMGARSVGAAKKAAGTRPAGAARKAAAGRSAATAKKTAAGRTAAAPGKAGGVRAAASKMTRRDRPAAAARRKRSPYGPSAKQLHGGAPMSPPSAPPRPAPAPAKREEAPRRAWGAPLEMPERYGRNHAALMARDPYWLFAYWEIDPRSVAELEARLKGEWPDHRWLLRVFTFPPEIEMQHAEEGNGEDRYDLELPPGAVSWYVNAGRADRVYRVAIGIVTRSGKFHALARSNAVRTPRDAISPITDEEWTRAPESYRRLYAMIGEELSGGGGSSAELGLLLRERLQAEWSSGQLGSMGSGAFAKPAVQGPGFWFVLDTELIIYGATEPDARVTVQGRAVPLRPDGTFSLRFLLPEGTQVIDATALSADGAFRKTITPTVRRETSSTETIEEQVGS